MSVNSDKSKRIAKNTLLLYFRMLLTMAVTLYTSRVILDTLGIEDYGIYNVVGGVVTMFSLLTGSLSAAISRFITFELGTKNICKLKAIFSTGVNIQIILAFFIFVLAEVIGGWFLNTKMNIAVNRLESANWVLQCSILTFMITLISIPYNAAIIAHERMSFFAYISFLEVILKLAVVLVLYNLEFDKLKVYAVLLLMVAIIIRLIYSWYCKKNFEECKYLFIMDKGILKEMAGFAGWNFIGVSSSILRDQGVNITINLFCGAAVNAARGISFQVNSAVQQFVNNFMTALNPQITKSFALGDMNYMMTLIFQGARLSFYMLLFLSLPLIIEADSILHMWLGVVPEHTVNFVRLVLVFAMCESISGPLITAMLATGRIRNYQIIVGGLQMLNFPFSFLLLKCGYFPEITMVVAIFISQCCLFARLLLLKGMIGLSARRYIKEVYFKVLIVGFISSLIPISIYSQFGMGIYRFILIIISCLIGTIISIFYVGLTRNERNFVLQKIRLKFGYMK